jgi:glutamate-ammonia-ligase adenylyltransferase
VIGDKSAQTEQSADPGPISGDASNEVTRLINQSPDPDGARDRIQDLLGGHPEVFDDPVARSRIVNIAASSRALAASVTTHPELLAGPARHQSVTLQVMAALVTIAGDDLAGTIDMAEATRRYSHAMDDIVSGALARAKEAVAESQPAAADLPFAVIAMGKWGAEELNYYSDIDLVFVHEAEDTDAAKARDAALAIASRLIRALSSQTFDGPALEVDANLRPEGTRGPLSRTIDSYQRYYREWGEAWELQALIKARHAAGSEELGSRFVQLARDVVWQTGLDAEALRSIRRIKEQTEQSAKRNDIKRARGGIRDIEFTVQLLQIVHGRSDSDIRMPSTLHAVEALAANGYIDREDAEQLDTAYRFLRDLEHRIQLWEIRQTRSSPFWEACFLRQEFLRWHR